MNSQQLERLIGKLPATPGIHGKSEYVNTCVLVLLMMVEGEYHFVFEKRSPDIRQGGEICFPGGVFDPNKDTSFLQTAIRETVEELGISEDKLTVLGASDTLVAPLGVTVDAFVGIADIDSLDQLRVNTREVEYVFSVPVSYFEECEPEKYSAMVTIHPSYVDKETGEEVILLPAEQLGLPERYTKPWGGSKYNVYAYRVEKGVIWGITARFIYEIIKKLKR